jgi:hypothetical protein
MSPAEALKEAKAAGVHVALDGDHLLLEAKSPPPARVLKHLSQHKATIIALLRWHNKDHRAADSVRSSSPVTGEAENLGMPAGDERLAELRKDILRTLDRLPLLLSDAGIQLLVETRKFVRSHWFCEAIVSFPLQDTEQWGLVTGLALAPKRGDAIEYLDAEHAVIRYCVTAPINDARRIERRFTPASTSVVWWKCLFALRDR